MQPPAHLLKRRELPQEVTWTLVPVRVDIQIFLMIVLCIPPLSCRQDLRDNLPLPPLRVRLLRHLLRRLLLFRVVVEDGAPVLRTRVWPLRVHGRRIVHLVEEFDEFAIAELLGVVEDLERLRI